MTKRVLLACIIAILLFSTLCLGVSCGKRDYAEVLEANWSIVLPEGMTESYRKSEDTFWGEGVRYAVFSFSQSPTEEPTDFLADFDREPSKEMENAVLTLLLRASFKVPNHSLPDFNSPYCWKHIQKEGKSGDGYPVINECYMIFFLSEYWQSDYYRLVICQNYG